jgi:hypothetical protein
MLKLGLGFRDLKTSGGAGGGAPTDGTRVTTDGDYRATTAADFRTLENDEEDWMQITVEISSTELLNSNITPIEIVPAPGAGFVIVALAISAKTHFETTPYNFADYFDLCYGSLVGRIPVAPDIQGMLQASSDKFSAKGPGTQGGDGDLSAYENLPINLSSSDAVTDGDGTLSITVQYAIIPV